jgi:hypothetical protein
MRVKYVVVHEPTEHKFSAILFPEQLVHRDVASVHRAGRRNVVSAGFAQIDYDQGCGNPSSVHVYGRSESLDLGPRPEDAEVIRNNYT